LYVDYKNRIISPAELNEKDFKLAMKAVLKYVDFCNSILLTLKNLDEKSLHSYCKISRTKKFREILESVFSRCTSKE